MGHATLNLSCAGHGVLSERKRHRDWVDVDAMNHDDPQACSHYAQDIMMHLREAEVSLQPTKKQGRLLHAAFCKPWPILLQYFALNFLPPMGPTCLADF